MAATAGSGPAQDRRQHADELALGFHVVGASADDDLVPATVDRSRW
ncbi:hypothetical protein [Nocardia brasiliensis]|nr:hypothetical protein [Nocardia brasiliensis]